MNESNRVESVFAAAVALADGDREAYLDQACSGDAALRQRVEALLRAHQRTQHFLDRPEQTVGQIPAVDGAGAVVAGRYKLLESIGEGGMGTVWMAEQREPVKRLVALKLIRPGMDSKAVLARFEAERQALALMDHPNIAKVLDGGTTENGHPYFVMELVKGLPLTEYCDGRRLRVPDRLQLFVQICSAVQHAHQKGIIHRDLKPSNILVTEHDGKPVPKVIDFGLAKALATGTVLTERTLHTAYGTVVGTPLYMAPEQVGINALDVDTRTDIYTLGAILYELLTGTTPLEKKRYKAVAWDEIRRLIREEEPPRPSLRLSSSEALASLAAQRQIEPSRLSRLVKGDLDWIVLKALEKDRNRRYETANSLAMDVQRHLAGEPVLAAPASVRYRLRKFLHKRRGPVLAAALVLLALLAGMAGTSWGLVEAMNQRDEADAARADEELQRRAAESNARKAATAALAEVQQRRIADANAKKATEAAEEARKARDREAEHRRAAVAAQQRAMAALRATTDEVMEQLLATRDSLGPAEKVFLQATLARWQAFAAEQGDSKEAREIRAEGLRGVAFLRQKLGEREAALVDYAAAILLTEQLATEFPDVPQYRGQLTDCRNNRGVILSDLRQDAAAEQELTEALRLSAALAAEFPGVASHRWSLAVAHANLGQLLTDLHQRPKADKHLRLALDLLQQLVIDVPTRPTYRYDLARTHNNLGVLCDELDNRAEAEKHHRAALALREQLLADFPGAPSYRHGLAGSHNNVGNALKDRGQNMDAETHYRTALELLQKLVAEYHAVPAYRQSLARAHYNLAYVLTNLHKPGEAEEHYRASLALREKLAADLATAPAARHELARCHCNLGVLLKDRGKLPLAEEQYRAARDLYQKLVAEWPGVAVYREELARVWTNVGILEVLSRSTPKAIEASFQEALGLSQDLAAEFPDVPKYRIQMGGDCVNVGIAIREGGKVEDSLAWFTKAIATITPLVEKEPRNAGPFLRNAHLNRAVALERLGRHAEAAKDWERCATLTAPAEQGLFKRNAVLAQVKGGQVAEAVAAVAELTRSSSWSAAAWYDFARVYALASAQDQARRDEYAARAVELLTQAVKAGYNNAALLKADPDLAALRGREPFEKLLQSLSPTNETPPRRDIK